jgi:hypothetical protein
VVYVKAQQLQNNKTQTCPLLQHIQPLLIFFDLTHLSIPYPVTSFFLEHPIYPATKRTAFNKDNKNDSDKMMMMMTTHLQWKIRNKSIIQLNKFVIVFSKNNSLQQAST